METWYIKHYTNGKRTTSTISRILQGNFRSGSDCSGAWHELVKLWVVIFENIFRFYSVYNVKSHGGRATRVFNFPFDGDS
jgi:hypothetical protein